MGDRARNGRFTPGHTPLPGGGRRPGAKNRFTEFKNAILETIEQDGDRGRAYLKGLKKRKEGEFLALLKTVTPRNVDISGDIDVTVDTRTRAELERDIRDKLAALRPGPGRLGGAADKPPD